jgi:hypothetical protein
MAVRDEVAKLGQGGHGADADCFAIGNNTAQIRTLVQKRDRREVPQPLGHPEPDIRRPGDQGGVGVRVIPGGEFVGRCLRREGLASLGAYFGKNEGGVL